MVLSARGGRVRGSDGMPFGSQQTPSCGVLLTSNFVVLVFSYGSFVYQKILQCESFYLEDTELGENRVGEYWGRTKKRFWRDSMFSCNRQLRKSFLVCSLEIVSLRYGWKGPTDKNRNCFGKTDSVLAKQKVFCRNRKFFGKTESVLPKHFLFCQNNFVFWP